MKKGIATNALIAIFGVIFVGIFMYMVFAPTPASIDQNKNLEKILDKSKTSSYSGYDVEFEVHDLASEQDAAADIDIDVFEWDASKNGDLVDDNYLDCSGVTPAKFDGTVTQTDVPQSAFCLINVYKFMQDTNFNAGDSETKIAEHLKITKADLDDIGGSTTSYHVNNGKTYLVTIGEGAAADNYDVLPMAFLFEASSETTLDPSELENGNINVRFSVDGYADAGAESQLTVSGEWEDSEGYDGSLTSTLAGIISATGLTTATTIDIDGVVTLEVNKNGYALPLGNPLAQSPSEKAYLVVTPYGEGTNGTAFPSSSAAWEEYGTGDLTGDVGYGTTVQSTNDQIIWSGMSVCGQVITDSSTSDAVKMGDEKIYEPSCWKLEKRNGIYGIFDNDAKIEMDFHIDSIPVDYDAAVNATNAQLDYASGSSPEVIADIDLITLSSGTDRLAQTLG